jgi:hypothetical protein
MKKKKRTSKPGMEVHVHACGPSYTGGIGRRNAVGGWSLSRNARPYLKTS